MSGRQRRVGVLRDGTPVRTDSDRTLVKALQLEQEQDHSHPAAGKEVFDRPPADRTPPVADKDVEGMPRRWNATDLRPAAQPRWLAKGRLPRGAISLLVGDEGIGKSLLWVWIVAAVTTGEPLPEFGIPARVPGHVILVCTEDDWTTTVRPRLEVADADLAMVQVICTEDDGSGAPVFPRDLFLIAEAEPAPALVVVDAWLDTVPAVLSVRDPQQARRALHPWKEVANATDAAVLLLCHTNRVASANARDRYGATGELRKKARMTLYARGTDDGRLIVGPEKMNTAAPIAASTFAITSVQHFTPTADNDGTVPLLVYVSESERTAREHIADTYESDHGSVPQDRADAERWLREYLFENPGAKSVDVKREAKKDAAISERTLQRAAKKLGVIVGYVGMPAVSVWTLANDTTEPEHNGHFVGRTSPTPCGATGISPRQQVTPSCANGGSGATVAQQQDQQNYLVVPDVTVTDGPVAQQPPAGLKPTSPGQTKRVHQILAKFTPPTGPGRCDECSYQVPRMGHRATCSKWQAEHTQNRRARANGG